MTDLAPKPRTSRAALWIITAITLIAAVMRFVRLESLAPAAWYDEVWFALRARELLQTHQLHVFYPTSFGGANAGLVYLTALVQLLGITTITSARWVLALAGVIAVPLAYRCFKSLAPDSKELVGILAAVFLAVTLFDVIITRVGMESGIAPAVALFVVWQITVGARHGQMLRFCIPLRHFALAGLILGLAQYNGLHARFVIPVAVYLITDLLVTSRGDQRRRVLIGAAVLFGVAVLVASPLIAFFIREPQWLTARSGFVARFGFDPVASNLIQIARVFSIEGSYDPKTTVPGVPLLDLVQSIGFYVGLAWCIWNVPRRLVARLLIVWLIAAALPGVLTDGANLQRMIGIAAPLAGIVAVGWWKIASQHFSMSAGQQRQAVRLALIFLILASMGWNAYLLFVRWPQEPKLAAQFTAAPVDLARTAISADHAVYAERIPEAEDIIAWEYLFPGTAVTRLDFRKCIPMPHRRSTPTSYLILTDHDDQTAPMLRQAYPSSTFRARNVDLWQGTAAWIDIPAGVDAAVPPRQSKAEFDKGISLYGYDWSADTLHPGETLFITLYWLADQPVGEDLTAFAHVGTGLEGSALIAQRDGQPCVSLYPTSQWHPGEVIPDSFAITLPEDTPPGDYPIAVGWYSFPSLERVRLMHADQPLPDDRAVIGTIHVEP